MIGYDADRTLLPELLTALLAHGIDPAAVTVLPTGEMWINDSDGGRIALGCVALDGNPDVLWWTATAYYGNSEAMIYEGTSANALAAILQPKVTTTSYVTVQLLSPPLGVQPKPYHVTEPGAVGRQDHWHGNPLAVIGFAAWPGAASVDLCWSKAWEAPQLAVGMYPITAAASGQWSTGMTPVESMTRHEGNLVHIADLSVLPDPGDAVCADCLMRLDDEDVHCEDCGEHLDGLGACPECDG